MNSRMKRPIGQSTSGCAWSTHALSGRVTLQHLTAWKLSKPFHLSFMEVPLLRQG